MRETPALEINTRNSRFLEKKRRQLLLSRSPGTALTSIPVSPTRTTKMLLQSQKVKNYSRNYPLGTTDSNSRSGAEGEEKDDEIVIRLPYAANLEERKGTPATTASATPLRRAGFNQQFHNYLRKNPKVFTETLVFGKKIMHYRQTGTLPYSKRLYPSLQKKVIKLPDTVDFMKEKAIKAEEENIPRPSIDSTELSIRGTFSPTPKSRADKSYKTGGGFDVGKVQRIFTRGSSRRLSPLPFPRGSKGDSKELLKKEELRTARGPPHSQNREVIFQKTETSFFQYPVLENESPSIISESVSVEKGFSSVNVQSTRAKINRSIENKIVMEEEQTPVQVPKVFKNSLHDGIQMRLKKLLQKSKIKRTIQPQKYQNVHQHVRGGYRLSPEPEEVVMSRHKIMLQKDFQQK